MSARDVGGATDRNSLSARQANGATMLVEVDAAALAPPSGSPLGVMGLGTHGPWRRQ